MGENRDIRVLIAIDSLVRGGRERRLVELLKGFRKVPFLKIVVVIFRETISYPEVSDLKNIELIILKRRIKKDPSVVLKLYRICKNFRPDVIHSWGSTPSVYLFLIAWLLRIKFINAMIANVKCPTFGKAWWHKQITFPFSDLIVSNSAAGIRAYKVPEKKARVVNNGFNFERTKNLEDEQKIRKRFNVKTELVVGMVASFTIGKDYGTYFQAAERILEKRDDVTFMFVGGGHDYALYKDAVKSENKNFMIFTDNQLDVESIINIFHVAVLTTYSEGISNSIMEYMALGKPVIVTEGGGSSEIVADQKTGYIIDHGSIEQLVAKIEYLLDNPRRALEMGAMGKQRIVERFNIDRMVQGTIDLYDEVLDSKR